MIAALLRLSSFRAFAIVSFAIGCALLPLPLLAVHGVESAVVLGAILPPLCAALGARVAIAARATYVNVSGLALALRALLGAQLVLGLPLLVLAVNQLRVRNCAPLEGLAFIALGPGFGVSLAALVGAILGALIMRPRLATTLAVLVPLADSARALYDFYTSPAVFAYGHFFGYFPGALYDELVELPMPLLTLRLFTSAACAACLCVLSAFFDPWTRRLQLRPQPDRRGPLLLLLPCLVAFAIGCLESESLGHRTSVAFIAQQLGRRELSAHCELILPREMRTAKRKRVADDCDFRVAELERWLGVRQEGRVRVLWFRSADEKRRLMGAADTNVAKPWRREVYVQDDAWPHPVLPHELAHIVLGNVGRGPLHMPGKLFGLVPDFSLVEGAAVAAAWSTGGASGLTPHQWTRAMLELHIAPSLSSLFGAGFLGQQSRLAYTVSGSLLRFIADTYGAKVLRTIYARGDLLGVLHLTLPELERRFHAFLMTVELPDSARALARLRFSGSSIIYRACPHEKAKLRQELDGYLAADDGARAEQTCGRLLAIDPGENVVRATLVGIEERRGEHTRAERNLARLIGPPAAPAPLIAAARQSLADELWRRGEYDAAHAIYRELLVQPNDRDAVRQLQVKALGLEGSARQRELVFQLLVGEPGQTTDSAIAIYLARELRAERSDGLPYYLEARQLFSHERYAYASGLLSEARKRGLPTREIAIEGLRLAGVSAYALGDVEGSRARWTEEEALGIDAGLRAEAEDWLERIASTRGR